MRRRKIILVLALATFLGLGCASAAQELTKPNERASALERLGTRARTLEEFGRDVVREALRSAAQRLKQPDPPSGPVEITMKLTVREVSRPPADPSALDVCWETSTGLSAYIQCQAESVLPDLDAAAVAARLTTMRRCEELFERLLQLNDPRTTRAIRLELMANGCWRWPLAWP